MSVRIKSPKLTAYSNEEGVGKCLSMPSDGAKAPQAMIEKLIMARKNLIVTGISDRRLRLMGTINSFLVTKKLLPPDGMIVILVYDLDFHILIK